MARPKAMSRIRSTPERAAKTSESAPDNRPSRGAGGRSSPRARPVISDGSASSRPFTRSPSTMSGMAATVALRSPPPSCSNTTLPGRARDSTRAAIFAGSRSMKSSGSTSWPSVR